MAKAVHAFQLMKEYNTILFGLYFKGFELLRRYLVKHNPETKLEDLDFEVINKEIEADEVAQAAQVTTSAGEDPPMPKKGEMTLLKFYLPAYIFLFFWVPCLFWGF